MSLCLFFGVCARVRTCVCMCAWMRVWFEAFFDERIAGKFDTESLKCS